jgi:hypothetical protein
MAASAVGSTALAAYPKACANVEQLKILIFHWAMKQ